VSSLRLLAASIAFGGSLGAALLAAIGLGGARSNWLDVANSFVPFVLVAALVSAGLIIWSLDQGWFRLLVLTLSALAFVYAAGATGLELSKLSLPRSRGATFHLLTANVWEQNPTPARAADEILARDADAVLLQEAGGTLASQLARLQTRYPYASQCPNSDLLILSKRRISAGGCDAGSPSLDLVWASTSLPDGRPVPLATLHYTWPFPPRAQARQRKALTDWARARQGEDLILTGDFNLTPWSFALRRQDRGLAPLRRLTVAWFSWPARLDSLALPWPVPVLPIDHIYASPAWQLVRLERVRIPGSDHFGTEAWLSR
jgi:vancomycin resistance protein VanJ